MALPKEVVAELIGNQLVGNFGSDPSSDTASLG